MSNFDLASLAISSLCPTNKLIYDNVGMPGVYVQIGKQKLSDILNTDDTTIHPAFIVNGKEYDSFYCGKFQGYENGGRIYSLPGVDLKMNITHDQYIERCRAKGHGHHCITAAEWGFLANWCRKNGTMPKGNNNYGKDTSESVYQAIPAAYDSDGRTAHTLTGTGPLSWRHNGQIDGICDLNGNVWEWVAGIRLVHGELQVIPYNNAADPDVDTGASSAQWKAIKANAASWEDLFITPNGQGTTTGSAKLDYVSNHWQWGTSITSSSDSSRSALFHLTTASGIGATAKLYFQAMALLPEDNQEGDTYGGDNFYANNAAEERCAFRGGGWTNGSNTGVFYLSFNNPRSDSYSHIGGRLAYIDLEST